MPFQTKGLERKYYVKYCVETNQSLAEKIILRLRVWHLELFLASPGFQQAWTVPTLTAACNTGSPSHKLAPLAPTLFLGGILTTLVSHTSWVHHCNLGFTLKASDNGLVGLLAGNKTLQGFDGFLETWSKFLYGPLLLFFLNACKPAPYKQQ